jgi:hypothetical protein
MNVVADDKPVTIVWVSAVTGVNAILEVVLGDLDLLWGQLVVVIGIEIEVGNDVAEILHDILAVIIAGRVRWAHVGWVFADDVTDSHLVLDHLVVSLLFGNKTEVLVRPSVGGHLMAVVVHLLDDTRPVLINGTLTDVVTSDEESGMGSTCFELGHNVLCVDVWTIVVGDRNRSRVVADVYASTAVRDGSLLGTDIIAGACSGRSLVGVCITISKLIIVEGIEYVIPHAGPKLNKQSGAWQCSLVVPQYPCFYCKYILEIQKV